MRRRTRLGATALWAALAAFFIALSAVSAFAQVQICPDVASPASSGQSCANTKFVQTAIGAKVPACGGTQFVKGPATCATPAGSGSISGPVSSTIGNVPQWGNTLGTQLTAGLAPVTTTAAASLVETNGSGQIDPSFLPPPSASTLGGIESFAAVSSQWIRSISTAGVPAASQPGFSDLSGQATLAQLPSIANNSALGNVSGSSGVPSALTTTQLTTLCNTFTSALSGCVPSPLGATTTFLKADGTWAAPPGATYTASTGITLSGTNFVLSPIAANSIPANATAGSAAPITAVPYGTSGNNTILETGAGGTILASALPNPSASTLGGIESLAAVTSKWINAISTSGVPSATQPACSDLSNGASGCSTTVGTMATQAASAVAITGGSITGLTSPVNPTDAATKSYVDTSVTSNTVWHSGVSYATAAVLPNSPTYNNGASGVGATLTDGTTGSVLVVDGQNGANVLNTRILVMNQAAPANNGIYSVTTSGVAATTKWVLTRATDFNTAAAGNIALGAAVLVTVGGTANTAGSAFVLNQTAAITVGTTALTFAQNATGGTAYTASNGITLSGTNFALTNIAANSVPANASGSPGPPTTAVSYSATAGANTIAETGAGGTLAPGFLPPPTASTLGGTESLVQTTHQWINQITTSGVPVSSQPGFSDLSGSATLAQLPAVANNTVYGNVSGGSAVPVALSTTQLTTLCNQFTAVLSGCAPLSGGGTTTFLRADGTWAAPSSTAYTASGGITLTGANFALSTIAGTSVLANTSGSTGVPSSALCYGATSASTSCLLQLGAGGLISATVIPFPSATTLGGIESLSCAANLFLNVISTSGVPSCTQPAFSNLSGQATLAQLPNIGNNTALGNVSGGSAVPVALSTAQFTTLCNLFTSALSGCAPSPLEVGTTKFLREDGAWMVPPGTAGAPSPLGAGLGSSATTFNPGSQTLTAGGSLFTQTATALKAANYTLNSELGGTTDTARQILANGSASIQFTLPAAAGTLGTYQFGDKAGFGYTVVDGGGAFFGCVTGAPTSLTVSPYYAAQFWDLGTGNGYWCVYTASAIAPSGPVSANTTLASLSGTTLPLTGMGYTITLPAASTPGATETFVAQAGAGPINICPANGTAVFDTNSGAPLVPNICPSGQSGIVLWNGLSAKIVGEATTFFATVQAPGQAVTAQAYFASPTGNDSNPGTITAPFLTPIPFTNLINATSSTVPPMRTLYFRAGTYDYTNASAANLNCWGTNLGSGAVEVYPYSNVTFSYYPPDGLGSAIINGGSSSGNLKLNFWLCAFGNSNVNVIGLTFTNWGYGAIMFKQVSSSTIKWNTILNTWGSSNCCMSGETGAINAGYLVSGIKILNNYIYNYANTGIDLGTGNTAGDGAGAVISGNVLENGCTVTASAACAGIHVVGLSPYPASANLCPNSAIAVSNNYVNGLGSGTGSIALYTDNGICNVNWTGNVAIGGFGTALSEGCAENHGGNNIVYTGNICDITNAGTSTGADIMFYQSFATLGNSMTGNTWSHNIIVANSAGAPAGSGYVGNSSPPTGMTLVGNAYHNYGSPGTGGIGGINNASTGSAVASETSATAVAAPGISCWNALIAAGSAVFSAPVSFAGLSGAWGPPGLVGPSQSQTTPSWGTAGCVVQ